MSKYKTCGKISRMDEDEYITFRELGRRMGLSQQRISQLAAAHDDFPPRRKAGPAYQVSWQAAKAWFDRRSNHSEKVEPE